MDSSNTIKEFFENQGGIKMELNTISGLAIAGVICSVVLSMGVPIALFIAGRVKLKARISSFFIGAGTFLLFAMLLEQQLQVLVYLFCIRVGKLVYLLLARRGFVIRQWCYVYCVTLWRCLHYVD